MNQQSTNKNINKMQNSTIISQQVNKSTNQHINTHLRQWRAADDPKLRLYRLERRRLIFSPDSTAPTSTWDRLNGPNVHTPPNKQRHNPNSREVGVIETRVYASIAQNIKKSVKQEINSDESKHAHNTQQLRLGLGIG